MFKILRPILFLLAIVFAAHTNGQKFEKVIVSKQDPYELYKYEGKDTSDLFYLKLVPKGKPIGVLVVIPGGGEHVEDVFKQITLHKLALLKNFIIISPSINYGTFNFNPEHKFLDTIFKQIVTTYNIPKDKFILGGLSGGGMISLTYAQKANKNPDSTYLKPRAIFALDPPLDYANLYKRAKRDVERNFSEPAVDEGHMLMAAFKQEIGGSPDEKPAAYVAQSIYSYSEPDGGNAKYLLDTPLIIYTEPGIEWEIKEKQRDLYDTNCLDITAMINLLRIKGNKNADIVVTHNKGVRLDGSRHPHSWSIMDGKHCLNWMMKYIN